MVLKSLSYNWFMVFFEDGFCYFFPFWVGHVLLFICMLIIFLLLKIKHLKLLPLLSDWVCVEEVLEELARLFWALGSAQGESLRSSQVFSKHVSFLGLRMWLFNYLMYTATYKCLSCTTVSPQFLFGSLDGVLCVFTCNPLSQTFACL